MKKNIVLITTVMILILSIIITFLSLYNLRTAGIKSAIHNAQSISEVIKSGLTSHMINNNMNQVDTFLQSVSNIKNVDKLWLVRSEKLNKQFNKNLKNPPRDSVDENVLKTGKMKYIVKENITKTSVRVTIPYNAVADKGIDCLKCHNVNSGDTLGAVSIELDISILKDIGIESLYLIIFIISITIIFFLILSKKILNPYTSLLSLFKTNMKDASIGDFKEIITPNGLSNEMNELTNDYNKLMQTFKDTTEDIDKKLHGFVGYQVTNKIHNPLVDSKDVVNNLSDLYQFKKQVEKDDTKEEIYKRFSEILLHKFNIQNFTFLEINVKKQKLEKVLENGDSFYCSSTICDSPELCRSARTKSDVFSVEHHNTCQYFDKKDKYYYCFNLNIARNLFLIVHCVVNSNRDLEILKENAVFIKSYLKEIAPVIEVKLLMNALKESAFRDGLTGLYNRKFLEENTKKLVPQAIREEFNIGVLMLDMDHFKAVNDEYGHDIGDKVLKELARILKDTLRESDLIIRYGGEEFIVLLVGVKTEDDAMNVAKKIGTKVRENEIDVYAGTKLKKTISIGLSMFPQDAKTLDVVLKNADIALYEAKNSGRDKVIRFNEEQVTSVDLF